MATTTNSSLGNSTKEPQADWQKVVQKVKSFFTVDTPKHKVKSKLDYFHEYVFPYNIERKIEKKE